MAAAVVGPRLARSDVTELVEDAAHHLIGAALTAEQLELSHHTVEHNLDVGDSGVRVAVTLAIQPNMAALEFFAVEVREQGHSKQGVHVVSGVSERQLPL